MAFSFGNAAGSLSGGSGAAASSGPDLETIQTEELGFLSIAGDSKVRLTTPWASLPAPTASLLGIASKKGVIAAAGPDQITIATSESVRKGFEGPKEGDSEIRSFEPQLKLPMPMRISQLAFTADENYLILSAETGGGLAVYEVQSLLSGSTNSAFELSTNGESLRALAPNPTAEKAELCAIVTTNGNLLMANLKERRISNVLKPQVSCVGWSSKGKQLCAGLVDGTIHQMTPEGEGKAEIPRPSDIGNHHVSSIVWLENHLWLAIYTATGSPPSTVYHIITRQPPSSFNFQKIADPVEPFVPDKTPYHSLLRLRDFPPTLQDLLIVSSSASTEMGLLSRSQKPLATDKPASSITGVFTTTEMLDDTRRPTLPMTDSMEDSTPVGIALDLSSKEKVYKPIPSDEELNESPTPLPGLWVLTHEGLLCAWWLVYNDSIKNGTTYPGLTIADASNASANTTTPAPAATSSPFGGNTGASAFGSAQAPAPAFGSSSQLGTKSPWGAPTASGGAPQTGGATFGQSSFGSSAAPSAPAFGKPSAFGQSSQLGMRTSPWSSTGGSAPAFGQSGFASLANKSPASSPFGSAAQSSSESAPAPSSGGFAGFASQGGFASVAAKSSPTSAFGSATTTSTSPFGSSANNNGQSAFGAPSKPTPNPFAPSSTTGQSGGGLFGSAPFKLESSFKPDTSKEDADKASTGPGGSMFGNAFGSALDSTAQKPADASLVSKDEDMDAEDSTEQASQAKPEQPSSEPQASPGSTTPKSTPASLRFGTTAPQTSGGSIFGQKPSAPSSGGGIFGSNPAPQKSGFSFLNPKETSQTEEPQAPLPPDTTSKLAYPLGDSSSSSAASNAPPPASVFSTTPSKPVDAPLPPDPTTATPKAKKEEPPKDGSESGDGADAPLPPDFVNVPRPKVPSPVSLGTESSPTDETPKPEPSAEPEAAPLPPDFTLPKPLSKEPSTIPSLPEPDEEEEEDGEEEEEDGEDEEGETDLDDNEDNATEGSGVYVTQELSPEASGFTATPGFTPQSSFGGVASTTPATGPQTRGGPRPLFGEISRNAPLFARPNETSPRSPSPIRGAVPDRVIRSESTRSVSAPGMASQIIGAQKPQSQLGKSIVSHEKLSQAEDSFVAQHRKLKERQEMEETQPLVDEEDDEIQKILASEVDGTLSLDEFIAHSNTAPPAKESIPSQVEAVYRDINSMIDTVGLNARSVKAFVKGHTENRKEAGRGNDDLETPDDWVLCEIDELGRVLDTEVRADLAQGRVGDLEDKLEICQDLARDMHRLRAKQEDLRKIITLRMDPAQVEVTQSLPLSAEQSTQQNELRRELANFSKAMSEAEEALTILKTRIASASATSGRGSTNVPTVEAVMRTISKMTGMVEKRSGDVDVLENQLRKVRLSSTSREGSPMVTPQARRSVMFSPDSTPSRNLRHSLAASVGSFGGSPARSTPPRKKVSGFSREEKSELMEKRARRQAVLGKFKDSVEKRGVNVWNMEDID